MCVLSSSEPGRKDGDLTYNWDSMKKTLRLCSNSPEDGPKVPHPWLLLLGQLKGSFQHRDLGQAHEEQGAVRLTVLECLSPVPASPSFPGVTLAQKH